MIFIMSRKLSPCIDVCKYKNNNHCIGCSMTKLQKKISKKIKKTNEKLAFLDLIIAQQRFLGGYEKWEEAFNKKENK